MNFKIFTIIVLILITVSGTVATVGYFYYKNSQAIIRQLEENNTKLEVAVNQQQNTIEQLQQNSQLSNQIIKDLNNTLSESRVRTRELEERLSRHDISLLAATRPELVERIINNASDQALRCFELLSGAPLNEKEKNAKTEREFNSECPYLFSTYRNIP